MASAGPVLAIALAACDRRVWMLHFAPLRRRYGLDCTLDGVCGLFERF
jgi:hypothetical protein